MQEVEGGERLRVSNSVQCYCPLSDEWHIMPPMLRHRKDARGVVAIGKKIYIVDGIDYDLNSEPVEANMLETSPQTYGESYDLSQKAWEALPQRHGPDSDDFVSVTAMNDF